MRRTAAAPVLPDPSHLQRPRLAEDVVLHPPSADGTPWIVQKGSHTYLRLATDLADLMREMDGRADHAGLAEALGPRWSADLVGEAVGMLAGKGMLDDGSAPPAQRRVRFLGAHRIQLTVLRPDRLFDALRPLIGVLGSRSAIAVGLAVSVLGAGTLVLRAEDVARALGTPLPFAAYFAVAMGYLLTTCVHELSHGAVLAMFGGRPTRMGVMLFYFTPAFFCDVTDGWRLPRRDQRVAVALAGIGVQSVVAGVAALAAASLPLGPTAQSTAYVFAATTYVACLMNLLPFIKLDGYLALMSHLDLPHLREKAMGDARSWLGATLFGARRRRDLPQWWWAVPFGLASMAMPVYIVVTLLLVLADLLLGLGTAGAAAVLVVAGGALAYVLVGGARLQREALAAHAPRWRTWTVSAGLLLTAAAAAAVVPVPASVQGGYVVHEGQAYVVLPSRAGDVTVGDPVELYRMGLVTSTEVGRATVAGTEPVTVQAPIEAFLPITAEGLTLPAAGYPVTIDGPLPEHAGSARVALGTVPGWRWLTDTYLAPLGIGGAQ
ncbi:daptide biosynthesis intramembrane metalloprotease [Georgenia faecalis]|uniref:daptide biosynthesis intramembrane metalloprotease n=1 Tax=Georgenia faecalis TaxID=2483799 RepID=UPI000FD9769D|nr:daptide biosynthesis intramembrane metalloprotease [Georgenia faecalis]